MKGQRWIAALLLFLTLPLALAAQNAPKQRLILKDGSYQIVTKFEIKADHVHYFSAERQVWEDIPSALIDWDATAKWNKQHHRDNSTDNTPATADNSTQVSPSGDGALSEAAKLDAEAAAERADLRSRTPRVAPGLHLPEQDGVFVLDNFQDIPELVHLDQTSGNVNRDPGHNVLRAAMNSFHGAQEPVRIAGQAAKVRVHVDDPALYVSLDTPEQQAPEAAMVVDTHGASSAQDKNQYSSPDSRYSIVRVDVRPGERFIGAVRISRLGAVAQSEDIIPTNAEILPGKHWMKLTPKEPLPVGEYALMEILGPGLVNLDVWDFGVSPNAPENKHPVTPIKDGAD
jgi:hypothetical protein